MKNRDRSLTGKFLARARHSLEAHHLPRVEICLKMLSPEELWWRPHPEANSVGNLALHLEGNVRQWIVAGLGGCPDTRQRQREFDERGPLPRGVLLGRLRRSVAEACRVLDQLTRADLARVHVIQKFKVTGLEAISHVTEHFAAHTGQIIYATKLIKRRDLHFTRLPGEKVASRARALPAI
jgi:uncharacterized damage-inducible protein DinB